MSNELISVIIPIYNVENYLERCIDSVINQTYSNLEIILVDDGSPDNCPIICDRYAEKDSRIKVIHKKNGGLSDARNAGIKIATGKWIAFVDSDDHIENVMYEKLLGLALSNDAQISIGSVNDEIEKNGVVTILKTTLHSTQKTEVLPKKEVVKRFLNGSWSAWDKIYLRSLFDGIEFPVGEINEDEAIALLLLNKCKNVVYTNEIFYHYMQREQSITSSSFSSRKLDWVKHCEQNLDWIKENYPEFTPLALKRLFHSIAWGLREIALSDNDYAEHVKVLKEKLKIYYKNFDGRSCEKSLRVRIMLNRYLPFSVYRTLERALYSRKK